MAPPSQASEKTKELLKSANASAAAARNTWLGFTAVVTYLFVTVASTTHQALLLNTPTRMPIANVDIPLVTFFGFAPPLLLLLHLGLLLQHLITAEKYFALKQSIAGRKLIVDNIRPNIDYYIFAQWVIGNFSGSNIVRSIIIFLILGSLFWAPVCLMLYFQIKFLPYHHKVGDLTWVTNFLNITWQHRLWLVLDIVILLIFWIRMKQIAKFDMGKAAAKKAKNQGGATGKNGDGGVRRMMAGLGSVAVTALVSLVLILFSLFVATIPDGKIDRLLARALPKFLLLEKDQREEDGLKIDGRKMFVLTGLLFESRYLSAFSRNLIVEVKDLVDESEFEGGTGRSYDLRGRDLRYGRFTWIDLSYADLAHTDLTGADFDSATLVRTSLFSATVNGANFHRARLNHVPLNCADGDAQTRFTEARLDGAKLRGARLAGANFKDASLIDTDMRSYGMDRLGRCGRGAGSRDLTDLSDANLTKAKLQGSSIKEALFVKANFTQADLRGVDAKDTNFDNANFSGARLTAAALRRASMNKAVFSPAQDHGEHITDLRGANLYAAELRGADFADADLSGADLRKVVVDTFTVLPRKRELLYQADIDAELASFIGRPRADGAARDAGGGGQSREVRFSNFLVALSCELDRSEFVLEGINLRASQNDPSNPRLFNGDLDTLVAGLTDPGCMCKRTLAAEKIASLCEQTGALMERDERKPVCNVKCR